MTASPDLTAAAEILRDLAETDGSPASVAGPEILAARVRAAAQRALDLLVRVASTGSDTPLPADLPSGLATTELDDLRAQSALLAARIHELQQERDALRAERDTWTDEMAAMNTERAAWIEQLSLSDEARKLVNDTPLLLSLLYDLDLLPEQLMSQDECTPGLVKTFHRLYGVLYGYQAVQDSIPGMARDEAGRWRDAAFQTSIDIVRRWLSGENIGLADAIAMDIKALVSKGGTR